MQTDRDFGREFFSIIPPKDSIKVIVDERLEFYAKTDINHLDYILTLGVEVQH